MNNKYNSLANPFKDTVVTDLSKPNLQTLLKTTDETRLALEKLANKKIKKSGISASYMVAAEGEKKYIKYTPNQKGLGHATGAQQRIIQLNEFPHDPLEPTKFKHKRIPRENSDELIPVMHSPPRKITIKDMQDWKIPPCISNWKNSKGYTIPLDMRLSADGRSLKDYTISDKFSKFADVMNVTEKQARAEVEERNKIQESIKMVDTLRKEEELREAAKEARQKKMNLVVSNISSVDTRKTEENGLLIGNKRNISNEELEAAKIERNNLRNQRKKEIERDRRIEVAGNKKAKLTRDIDRDVSEKIALGQAQPTSREAMVDSRLYNQTVGLEAGFKGDDDYDLYDKPLFADRTAANIYRNTKANSNIDDIGGEDKAESKKIMEKIYKRGKMFEGAEGGTTGGKPVEFEKQNNNYGLNEAHKKDK